MKGRIASASWAMMRRDGDTKRRAVRDVGRVSEMDQVRADAENGVNADSEELAISIHDVLVGPRKGE